MSPTPLILFPCNGNSREIVGVVDALNAVRPQFDLLGFVDDQPHRWGTTLCGVPVLGGREVLEQYPHALVVAQPGSPSSFRQRCQIIDSLHLPKERFAPALIHPQATLGPGCELGRNVVLYAGVRLTAHVTVGDHCLVLSNSVLAHEVVMEDFAIVTSQVGVAGGVRVGRGCYVGSGALLGSDITLGTGPWWAWDQLYSVTSLQERSGSVTPPVVCAGLKKPSDEPRLWGSLVWIRVKPACFMNIPAIF